MVDPVETPIGTLTPEHVRPGHVRHQVVVGPKFLFTLFTPQDRMHVVSWAFMEFVREGERPYRRLIVNEHIVDEAATRLQTQASMDHASMFLQTLDESSLYKHESVSAAVFETATRTFIEWTALDASFTDFVVVAHMEALEVDHIVTFDSHFDAFDVTTLPYRA